MLPFSVQSKQVVSALRRRPQAFAAVKGSASHPGVAGTVLFFQTNMGVLVVADITGLPHTMARCQSPIFAFHIHEGTNCSGSMDDPFADAMAHYNPNSCQHPYHAGDMPPLFGNNGSAFSAFLTDRFTLPEIIGKTVIIHDKPDDFTSQPSGNSGEKIACGEIRRFMS